MPKLRQNRVPAYRLHRQSGQAIVSLSGRDYLLGEHGSKDSREKYERLIARWLEGGRRLPYRGGPGDAVTVSRLVAEFWGWAKTYHRDRWGELSPEAGHFKRVLVWLRRLYGATPAPEFDILALKAIRAASIKPHKGKGGAQRPGWSRQYANAQMRRIVRVFKWGAENKLVPGSVYVDIGAMAPLLKNKTDAREKPRVRAAKEEVIKAILPLVAAPVAALVQLQLVAGCRPGEAVIMRRADVDTSVKPWVYRPAYHKLEHHDIEREIPLGPRARAVIEPFFKPDIDAYLFSPADGKADRRGVRSRARKTPLSCGNVPGSNVARRPKREPGDRYTVGSYRRAVQRGCEAAFPPPAELAKRKVKGVKGQRWETRAEWRARLGREKWAELVAWQREHRWCPLQVRHTFAKRTRSEHGIDHLQTVLGHRVGSLIWEVYAEADHEKSAAIVEQAG
jgi:integrase